MLTSRFFGPDWQRAKCNCFGCLFQELDEVFCHIYSVEVSVSYNLEFLKQFDEVIFVLHALISKSLLISSIVLLLEKISLLDYYVTRYLCFSSFPYFAVNGRYITGPGSLYIPSFKAFTSEAIELKSTSGSL